MKPNVLASLTLLAMLAVHWNCAHASDLPVCSKDDLLAYAPDSEETQAHRQFALPVIKYPFGTELDSYDGGLTLTLRVDEFGKVVCYNNANRFDEPQKLNAPRRDVIRDLGNWRYAPYPSPFSKIGPKYCAVSRTLRSRQIPSGPRA